MGPICLYAIDAGLLGALLSTCLRPSEILCKVSELARAAPEIHEAISGHSVCIRCAIIKGCRE